MYAKVEISMSMSEVDVLKKALQNYIGKLAYINNKVEDVSFENMNQMKREREMVVGMLKNLG